MKSLDSPMLLLPVHGTWGDTHAQWVHHDSAWWALMHDQGFVPATLTPFIWQANLEGADFWSQWFGWLPGISSDPTKRLRGWFDAADALCAVLHNIPQEQRVIIAHSHGLQPVLIAAASGYDIPRLVSVGSPVRHDVTDYIVRRYSEPARTHIGRWMHVMDARSDVIGIPQRVQRTLAGGIGDGHWSLSRVQELADINLRLHDIGHSELFDDLGKFHRWVDAGIVGFLKTV